jgi:hypothetical protein
VLYNIGVQQDLCVAFTINIIDVSIILWYLIKDKYKSDGGKLC